VCSNLIELSEGIAAQRASFQLESGQIHANRAVARRRREDGNSCPMSGGQQAAGRMRIEDGGSRIDRRRAGLFELRSSILHPQWSLSLRQVLADQMMKLDLAEGFFERFAPAQLPVKLVGAEQVLVVEDDVVNPDDLIFTKLEVVQSWPG